MNRAFGLATLPLPSSGCQSDHVLSGVPVLPVREDTSTLSPGAAFHEILPHVETESVSLTFDSYVPDVASVSPMRKSFPIFDDVAYKRFPTSSNRVVCSSVDSRSSVVFLTP